MQDDWQIQNPPVAHYPVIIEDIMHVLLSVPWVFSLKLKNINITHYIPPKCEIIMLTLQPGLINKL